jgi:SAM-dependent methyltransferase
MQKNDGLTDAESWDQIWSADDGHDGPRLRTRLASGRAWCRLLESLLDAPKTNGSLDVLELGCAPGAMIMQLHALRPQHRYRGLDNSAAGLKITRSRLREAGIAAELSEGDMRDADLPGADLVVSFGLAEHFADPAEAMRYHRRFVKPGGMVAVTVPNYANPLIVRLLRRFSPETLETHNLSIMSVENIREALRAAGFVDVVSGRSGYALLPSSRPRPGLVGGAYRFVTRAWNLAAGVLPEGVPWASSIWATGVNPN